MSSDYMPNKESAFLAWGGNFTAQSATLQTTFGFAEAELTTLQEQVDAFSSAYSICQGDQRTKKQVQIKNDAKKALKTTLRAMVRRLQAHPAITDAYRDQFRIPIRDRKPTPKPAPKTRPLVDPELQPPALVLFRFRGSETPRGGKDPGVHGIELRWAVLDQEPASQEAVSHSEFSTHEPIPLNFDVKQQGKRLYYMARWECGTTKKGPWTEIRTLIIP
jgi:hypothetical protein